MASNTHVVNDTDPIKAGQAADEYTCPMHPEVRQSGPGSCPKCGMALERAGAPAPPAAHTEYVCPMHAEIVRSEPGSCPICGMALEPRTASAQEEDNPELKYMQQRFWVGVAFTIPVFISSMGMFIPGHPLHQLASPRIWTWF